MQGASFFFIWVIWVIGFAMWFWLVRSVSRAADALQRIAKTMEDRTRRG